VIFGGGTTSALLVGELPAGLQATIATHSPSVATAFGDSLGRTSLQQTCYEYNRFAAYPTF
jgi:hypothetical protein